MSYDNMNEYDQRSDDDIYMPDGNRGISKEILKIILLGAAIFVGIVIAVVLAFTRKKLAAYSNGVKDVGYAIAKAIGNEDIDDMKDVLYGGPDLYMDSDSYDEEITNTFLYFDDRDDEDRIGDIKKVEIVKFVDLEYFPGDCEFMGETFDELFEDAGESFDGNVEDAGEFEAVVNIKGEYGDASGTLEYMAVKIDGRWYIGDD